jgi:acyl carrier protein
MTTEQENTVNHEQQLVTALPDCCSRKSSAPETAPSINEVRQWLKDYLQQHHKDISEPIRDDMSFDYIGLDSLARVAIMTASEQRFSLKLDPTAAYDFVTVGALSEFVWSQISGEALDQKKLLDI